MPKGIDLTEIAGYNSEDGRLLVELVALLNAGYRVTFVDEGGPYSNLFFVLLSHLDKPHVVKNAIYKQGIESVGVQYFIEELWRARYAMEHPDKLQDRE